MRYAGASILSRRGIPTLKALRVSSMREARLSFSLEKTRCPECGSDKLVRDGKELVCSNCGLITSDTISVMPTSTIAAIKPVKGETTDAQGRRWQDPDYDYKDSHEPFYFATSAPAYLNEAGLITTPPIEGYPEREKKPEVKFEPAASPYKMPGAVRRYVHAPIDMAELLSNEISNQPITETGPLNPETLPERKHRTKKLSNKVSDQDLPEIKEPKPEVPEVGYVNGKRLPSKVLSSIFGEPAFNYSRIRGRQSPLGDERTILPGIGDVQKGWVAKKKEYPVVGKFIQELTPQTITNRETGNKELWLRGNSMRQVTPAEMLYESEPTLKFEASVVRVPGTKKARLVRGKSYTMNPYVTAGTPEIVRQVNQETQEGISKDDFKDYLITGRNRPRSIHERNLDEMAEQIVYPKGRDTSKADEIAEAITQPPNYEAYNAKIKRFQELHGQPFDQPFTLAEAKAMVNLADENYNNNPEEFWGAQGEKELQKELQNSLYKKVEPSEQEPQDTVDETMTGTEEEREAELESLYPKRKGKE